MYSNIGTSASGNVARGKYVTEKRLGCPVCGHSEFDPIEMKYSTKHTFRPKWRSRKRPLLVDPLDVLVNPNVVWQNLYHYRCENCDYILTFAHPK